jgi:MoaA/NifB/PqqE/SkfB family radical SAM enzyme
MWKSVLNLLTGRPTLCVYDVTTRCNSRCAMCSIWKRREKEMTLEEVRKVFTDLKRFGIHTIFLQGGEPLVKKEVFEITGILDEMGFGINVITNGILLDENALKRLDMLNTRGRITVTVSLDTLDRQKYKRIRGVDRLDTVVENIRNLAKYRGLKGGVHATITSINYMELEGLRRFVQNAGLFFTFNSYNDNRNYASASDEKLDLQKTDKIEDVIREMERARDGISPLHSAFINGNIMHLRGEYVGPCDAFVNSLRINSEGGLSPCLELPAFFDLKKIDINREWKGIKRKIQSPIKRCYTRTPCYYGCTRGLGAVKKKPLTALRGLAAATVHEFFGKGSLR